MAPKPTPAPAAAAPAKPAAAAPAKPAAAAAVTKPVAAAAKAIVAGVKSAVAAVKTAVTSKPADAKVVKAAKAVPIASAARPLVAVRKLDSDSVIEQLTLPAVFIAPIRPDIVHFVHTSMAKNSRQAYSVSAGAGHQHSAESWGTGRAVARIPRVSGGGTSRAGQAAFGNMCRKGRMFAPTKTWRKWHRKINTNQKRFAVASALAASALPGLVFARGHSVEAVPEIPLVVDTAVESLTKTKQAIAALRTVGAYADVLKAKNSRKLRCGKGKLRDRRHVARRGPLIVYKADNGVVKAFRNLPGVEIAHVDSLNLLQLAPGGHLGRFVIWSKDAFTALNNNWGSFNRLSGQKKNYHLPRPIMANSDLTRIINSDEIQSRVRPAINSIVRYSLKKNPLTNLGARVKLNPYSLALRRSELLAAERRKTAKAAVIEAKRKGTTVPKSTADKSAAAVRKAHNATQDVNYARLTQDNYVPKKVVKQAAKPAAAKPAAAKPAAAAAKPAAAAAKPAAKK